MMEYQLYANKVSCQSSHDLPGETLVRLQMDQDQREKAIKHLIGDLTPDEWEKIANEINQEFGL